jgi:lysophospholipase L1-like esterase
MKRIPATLLALTFFAWLTFIPAASANLWITNYSAAHPLKIMAVGDSITDDCEVNGAWRQYLQPFLDGSGIPFAFVGRNFSTAYMGFTKVRHEGYCGAVIAAPGVMPIPVNGYAGTNVYLTKIVNDALNLSSPDIVLVLIGANDIGRGRDPYQVATNDMPSLLSILFGRLPNVHVILCKPTSLQDANLINYGAFATNMPIYCAGLQKVVNDRQAAGQHLYLADMFSAVDYSTMFMADHVHPNTTGLAAIAREFFIRIQSILVRPDQVTTPLIGPGATWSFSDQGFDLGTNWAQPNFDDSQWSNGIARLGYNDPGVATTVGFGPDPSNKFITTYFRRTFVVPWTLSVTNLNVRLARRDGAAVWLNGQELFHTNLPADPFSYASPALTAMTSYTPQVYYPTNFVNPSLLAGTNWLGVEIHQSAPTNLALGFDLELIAIGTNIPPPRLTIAPTSTNLLLSWPATIGAGYSLYSSPTLAPATWSAVTSGSQTNGPWIVAPVSPNQPGQVYRLQHP